MTGLISLLLRPSGSPSRRHLSDDCLLRISLVPHTDRPDEKETSHLLICTHCSDRLTDMTTALTKLPDEIEANFQAAFSPERLEDQCRQIVRRLVQEMPKTDLTPAPKFSARFYLTKPASLFPRSIQLPSTAAAVFLLLGLFASKSFDFATVPLPSSVTHVSAFNQSPGPAQASPTVGTTDTMRMQSAAVTASGHHSQISLEEFELIIAEYESAGRFTLSSTTGQITELASIDALTPSVRDKTPTTR